VRNGNEEDVDCGGPNCVECATARLAKVSFLVVGIAGAATAVVVAVLGLYFRRWYRLRQTAVVPIKAKPDDGIKRVSLMNSRRVVLGKQQSEKRRASSTVTPIVSVAWSQHESRQPSLAGRPLKGGKL
jgi:hypothetical protein